MKISLPIILLFLCSFNLHNWKTLDVEAFTIDTPHNWRYIKRKGVDSFVGLIKGPKVNLEFDFSDQGYAGLHVFSPQAYLTRKIDREFSKAFNDPRYTYLESDRIDFIKDKISASKRKLLRSIIHPTVRTKAETGQFDYTIYLTYNDSTIVKQVTLPEDIIRHNFLIDTTAAHIVTTIWPKKSGNGYTGVLIESLHSNFSFSMEGKDLPPKQERFALNAFKTIQIKEGH